MTNYQDIITRLEAASGPDRELDAMIAYLSDHHVDMSISFREYCEMCRDWREVANNAERYNSILYHSLPRYTASLDASIALVERKLPGCELEMTNLYGVARVTLFDVDNSFHGEDHCNRLQTALLIALFKALQAQEKDK